MKEYDRLLVEYADKFGEAVPIYGIAYDTADELLAMIRKAIEDGKPIQPQYSDDPYTVYQMIKPTQ